MYGNYLLMYFMYFSNLPHAPSFPPSPLSLPSTILLLPLLFPLSVSLSLLSPPLPPHSFPPFTLYCSRVSTLRVAMSNYTSPEERVRIVGKYDLVSSSSVSQLLKYENHRCRLDYILAHLYWGIDIVTFGFCHNGGL